MTFPDVPLPYLAPNTICPDPGNLDLFLPYFNRLYEDIALTVNQKDFLFYTVAIGTTVSNIPNIPNKGAFIICVSGEDDGMPAVTYSLIKTNSTVAGTATSIQIQTGTTGVWSGVDLLITSSATNFQIQHNAVSGTIGNFNIKFIGTM